MESAAATTDGLNLLNKMKKKLSSAAAGVGTPPPHPKLSNGGGRCFERNLWVNEEDPDEPTGRCDYLQKKTF
jgi:hypothetical protein